MANKKRSVQQVIEEQVKRWEAMKPKKKGVEQRGISAITVSREPGSGGKLVAKGIAEKLGFDLFHTEVIQEMAESTQAKTMLLETLDEKGLSILDDLIAAIVYERHLWPDEYLKHLMKVVGTIGKHGRAVIVGRGANFILSRYKIFRVRIIAPMDVRIQNVMREYGTSEDETKKRILKTESHRRAFVRKYFNANITDPQNYDFILNTGTLSIDAAVNAVVGAMEGASPGYS